jgi:hypothetical protein
MRIEENKGTEQRGMMRETKWQYLGEDRGVDRERQEGG